MKIKFHLIHEDGLLVYNVFKGDETARYIGRLTPKPTSHPGQNSPEVPIIV
jgi:hypothetical protein